MTDWHISEIASQSLTFEEGKDLRTISLNSSLFRNLVSSHLMQKFLHTQQNSADQSWSSNKRLWQTIEENFKDMKNIEWFEEINTNFNVFKSHRRLNSDKEIDEENLAARDVSIIEDQ